MVEGKNADKARKKELRQTLRGMGLISLPFSMNPKKFVNCTSSESKSKDS
jgi:hypothetical protein